MAPELQIARTDIVAKFIICECECGYAQLNVVLVCKYLEGDLC